MLPDPNSKIILQSSWRLKFVSEGIELRSLLRRSGFIIRTNQKDQFKRLFELLEKGVNRVDAIEALADYSELPSYVIMSMLNHLYSIDAIVPVHFEDEDGFSRHDRQRRFFNGFETSTRAGAEFNRLLQNRRVIIVGLGGYGGWLAMVCARIGIKEIVGIDPDVVELSNLSRQVIYVKDDIGKLKVDACKQAIAKVDDSIKFEGYAKSIRKPEDLIPYLHDADLVFNPFGYFQEGFKETVLGHIVLAALQENVPCLTFGGSWLGPLTIPRKTACYQCLIDNPSVNQLMDDAIPAFFPRHKTRFMPNFAPRVTMMASLAVWEAARFLSDINRSPILDGIIIVDSFFYEGHRIISVPRNSNCSACHMHHTQNANGVRID
jgi:molybdopterin-synthase adenylyltransferase